MSCATCPWKFLIWILSILMCAVGVILCSVGTYIYITFGDFTEFGKDIHTLIPASIMLASGVLLLLIAVLGFVGSCKESKCTLCFFFILAGFLFVLQVGGAIAGFVFKGEIDSAVLNDFNAGLDNYHNNSAWQDEIDYFQKHWKCCGVHNYTDWKRTEYYSNETAYPPSCCPPNKDANSTGKCQSTVEGFYEDGCYEKVKEFFIDNFDIVAGVLLGMAVLQVVALVGVIYLVCRKDERYEVF